MSINCSTGKIVHEQITWEKNYWGENRARWPYSWQPRVCPKCGTLHADDAITLLYEYGWDLYAIDLKNTYFLLPAEVTQYKMSLLKQLSTLDIHKLIPMYPTPEPLLYDFHMTAKQHRKLHLYNVCGKLKQ